MSLHRQARLAVRRCFGLRFYAMPPGQYSASGQGRKPMINFNSKSRPHDDQPGKPHPMAPEEVTKDFASFGKRTPPKQPQQQQSQRQSQTQQQSQKSAPPSSSASKGLPKADYTEFFEMPKRYWTRPPLEEDEMEAIMSGGATNAST